MENRKNYTNYEEPIVTMIFFSGDIVTLSGANGEDGNLGNDLGGGQIGGGDIFG